MTTAIMRKFVLLFIALTVCGSLSLAQDIYGEQTEDTTFSKWDLQELLVKNKIQTVQQLLTLLPEKIKQQAILVFQSRSLQAGSPLNPRVLLFNEDTSLVLTFNGDVAQYGYETVEVMSFNFEKNQFEFEEIVMPGDLSKRVEYLETQNLTKEIESVNNRKHRNGINPTTCLGCHRKNPRPNWEPYPTWPGVFGQVSGTFTGNRNFKQRPEGQNLEAKKFQDFVRGAERHPRYSKLGYIKRIANDSSLVDDVNLLFTSRLGKLNFRRLAIDIICHPQHELFKKQWPAFLQLTSASDLKQLEPGSREQLRSLGFSAEEFYSFRDETQKLQTESAELNLQLVQQAFYEPVQIVQPANDFRHQQLSSQLRFFLNRLMKFELGDYELTFKRGTYDFSDGYDSASEFLNLYKNLERIHKCGSESR